MSPDSVMRYSGGGVLVATVDVGVGEGGKKISEIFGVKGVPMPRAMTAIIPETTRNCLRYWSRCLMNIRPQNKRYAEISARKPERDLV